MNDQKIAQNDLKNRLMQVQERIFQACDKFDRNEAEIQLIGASKTKPANTIRTMFGYGLLHFGENYVNEAIKKQTDLEDLDIIWHYIGKIQSNKTKLIAQNFDWIHGIDRLKIAQSLNHYNEKPTPLNVLIQVNLDAEENKAGIHLEEATDLANEISRLPQLTLRGLMALPQAREDFAGQQACLLQLKQTLNKINTLLNLDLDTISAGMSNDLEAAIASGTTMVRVGTDLFGTRT